MNWKRIVCKIFGHKWPATMGEPGQFKIGHYAKGICSRCGELHPGIPIVVSGCVVDMPMYLIGKDAIKLDTIAKPHLKQE